MKSILSIFIGIVLFTSCKRDNNQFEGPSLQDLNGPFGMVKPFTASKTAVDFSKGEIVTFAAEFTKQCNWTITIYGDLSKARKIITGKSRQIDAVNGIWNGTTTVLPAFRTEPCRAVLKIDGVTDSFTLNIGINGLRIPQGLMIADFEAGLSPKWNTFIQSGANMDFKVKSDAFSVKGNYLNMAGTVTWDWLIGLIDFPASAYGANTFTVSNIPEDVYFNCLIYGDPNVANPSRVLFQFKEDDNSNNVFDVAADDQFDKEIIVNWQGWKLVSFKYSDLIHLVNGQPAPNNGNNRHNPNRVVTISMLHLANPSMGAGSTKIDYLIFTEKTPLEL
ncbi:MAG: hypothetical protein EBV15_00225 [Bacteroidetes bacterium]|jgi:hypothetical protein|nr:hypothetical protein [Bacteroidota bacterium]